MTNELWGDAITQASRLGRERSGAAASHAALSPADRIRGLKQTLDGEQVSFHQRLAVKRVGEPAGSNAAQLWEIGIPLTLFPKRDHGFARVECAVAFYSDEKPESFRVVQAFPERRTVVYAQAEIGGSVDISARVDVGMALPILPGGSMAKVAAEVYGKGATSKFTYKAERVCVETEVTNGTGARWRMDDALDSAQVGIESHQLRVLVETSGGLSRLDAAGVLEAHSDVKWLTSTVGSAWKALTGRVREFFDLGAPAQAEAQWQDILAGR